MVRKSGRVKPAGPGNQGGYVPGADPGGAAPPQAPAAPTGMQYGAHQSSIEAQRSMPLPGTPPLPTAAPGGVDAGNPMAEMLAHAQAMRPPSGGLFTPSTRPSEPVTAGLSSGPGPGPEALGQMPGSQMATRLAAVAQASGDPQLVRLAELARNVGAR